MNINELLTEQYQDRVKKQPTKTGNSGTFDPKSNDMTKARVTDLKNNTIIKKFNPETKSFEYRRTRWQS